MIEELIITYDTDDKEYDGGIPILKRQELVRCKDCKYDEQCLLQSFIRDNSCDNVPYTKDWFCADGDRKNDETD